MDNREALEIIKTCSCTDCAWQSENVIECECQDCEYKDATKQCIAVMEAWIEMQEAAQQ